MDDCEIVLLELKRPAFEISGGVFKAHQLFQRVMVGVDEKLSTIEINLMFLDALHNR